MPVRISFWSRLLDTIAPRQCVVCGSRLSPTEQALCSRCNLHLPRTGFHRTPLDNPMARLFWGQIDVERVAALFFYEAGSEAAQILFDMKYQGHPETARTMGRIMAAEMVDGGFFSGIDMIVPVPLAPKRLRQRGYNQSHYLAMGIADITGLPLSTQVACRTEFQKSQTRLLRWQRQENVEGVFKLRDAGAVCGHHVLLVDDVVTTGATTIACGRELLSAGNVTLSILSLAFTKQ